MLTPSRNVKTKQQMKKTLSIALILAGGVLAQAGDASFQLSLTPDIALQSKDTTIRAVSLGIWSENPQHSLTLGIVNGSTGESSGVSLAWGLNYTDTYTGVHLALVNVSRTSFVGVQLAAVNYSQGKFEGVQLGFVNYAQEASGVQLGWVNYAENLHGVQVGFVNIAMNNGWFDEFPDKLAKGFPFVNWSF